jgi:hypothetical protein
LSFIAILEMNQESDCTTSKDHDRNFDWHG